MKKTSALLAVAALAMFGLVACGGDDGDDETTAAAETTATEAETTGGGITGATVDIAAPADGAFAYEPATAETTAGSVTINFDNPAALSHDVVIEDESGNEIGKTDLVSESTASTTVELTPGTYTYYCDVPGHREGGMEGTLTVK
jgi:plastocyanin